MPFFDADSLKEKSRLVTAARYYFFVSFCCFFFRFLPLSARHDVTAWNFPKKRKLLKATLHVQRYFSRLLLMSITNFDVKKPFWSVSSYVYFSVVLLYLQEKIFYSRSMSYYVSQTHRKM